MVVRPMIRPTDIACCVSIVSSRPKSTRSAVALFGKAGPLLTETKNKQKLKKQKEKALGNSPWRQAIQDEEVKLQGVEFVKHLVFCRDWKRGSYGSTEWWNRRGRSDGLKNMLIRNSETNTRKTNETDQEIKEVDYRLQRRGEA